MPSTAITLNELYFAFQVSGKQIHDHDIEGHARFGLSINKKPFRNYSLPHQGFFDGAWRRIMLFCGHLVTC